MTQTVPSTHAPSSAGAGPLVTGDQIADLAAQVWSAFLQLRLEPAAGQPAAPAPAPAPGQGAGGVTMTAVVAISGGFTGSVVLECSRSHAEAAAGAMFAAEPASLSADEVADAVGELANMVGGNIKSLLPEPSALSIPTVTGGAGHQVFVPGARPEQRVHLHCGDEPVTVTLWRA